MICKKKQGKNKQKIYYLIWKKKERTEPTSGALALGDWQAPTAKFLVSRVAQHSTIAEYITKRFFVPMDSKPRGI